MLETGLQTRIIGCVLASFGQFSRRWAIPCGVVFAFVATSLSTGGQVQAASTAYINTDVLNLRSGPGLDADVIQLMWQGEAVTVLDGPTGDDWYYIDHAGSEGWAYGPYLGFGEAQYLASTGSDAGYGGWQASAWVVTDSLNIRSAASLESWILGVARSNDEIAVIGNPVDGFYPVSWWGQTAWAFADYLSFDGPAAAGPERWIDIDRSSQTVTLLEGDIAIDSFWAALGWDETADGFYATAVGTFYVYSKYEPLSWTDWGQTYITDWVGFDPSRQNGFHSFSRDGGGNLLQGGDGPTGGCVALAPAAADALYAFASYGMRVEVHW